MPTPELMMIRNPNSEFTIDPVLSTMMNSTISRKLIRVNTLARTMSHVVRPERGGRSLVCPRATRSATCAALSPGSLTSVWVTP
jgi:hypothetical protein